jgi:hypothetical protein
MNGRILSRHGGLSPNGAESITPERAEAGTLVLADAVLAAANAPTDEAR